MTYAFHMQDFTHVNMLTHINITDHAAACIPFSTGDISVVVML